MEHSGKVSYSIPEAVDATGLSRSTLYEALRDGKLVARKCGARTVIEEIELRRFINALPKAC
ncbi:MAG: helix-turn-helix domain-containing protein [Alphaproteobacteria bacterium]|nr:helix-turn-helix domain-containing protein [Alphaproteobacteria bacterium]